MTPDQAKAIATGTPPKYFDKPLINWLKFRPRKKVKVAFDVVPAGEPTPEEIAAQCEAIRAGWTPAIRRQREEEAGVFPATLPMASTMMFGRNSVGGERD